MWNLLLSWLLFFSFLEAWLPLFSLSFFDIGNQIFFFFFFLFLEIAMLLFERHFNGGINICHGINIWSGKHVVAYS